MNDASRSPQPSEHHRHCGIAGAIGGVDHVDLVPADVSRQSDDAGQGWEGSNQRPQTCSTGEGRTFTTKIDGYEMNSPYRSHDCERRRGRFRWPERARDVHVDAALVETAGDLALNPRICPKRRLRGAVEEQNTDPRRAASKLTHCHGDELAPEAVAGVSR